MAILLLLFCFLSFFINLGIHLSARLGFKDSFLSTVLLFSTLIVVYTEVASVFHAISYTSTVVFWVVILILNLLYIYFYRDRAFSLIKQIRDKLFCFFYNSTKYEKILSVSVVLILILVLIQGLVYPPNNWDSMTYHMARIPHWISNHSLSHYHTNIARQLYQPPFAEFVIMQFDLLCKNDYFSNAVQFLFLVFSIVAILSLLELFDFRKELGLFAVVLLVSIPEVVLQASSTQNDIVVSFFILTSIYFGINSIRKIDVFYFVLFGISMGLAVFTKATAYIYLAPIISFYIISVSVKLYKTKNFNYILYSVIALCFFVSINSGYYIRNYNFNGNVLGVEKLESKMYSNNDMSPKLFVSNLVKNMSLHIGPYPMNRISKKLIYMLDSHAYLDVNNANTNFRDIRFCKSPDVPNNEDTASNPIHFFLIVVSFVLVLVSKRKIVGENQKKRLSLYLLGIIISQLFLFCLYLKWQPWNTRLHTPIFILSVPLMCYIAYTYERFYKVLNLILPILIIYTYLLILVNYSRPFISIEGVTSEIQINDSRFKKYFSNRPNLYNEYCKVDLNLSHSNLKDVGLLIGPDDWEYPLFSNTFLNQRNPICVNENCLNKVDSSHKIECLISTTKNVAFVIVKKKKLYNQNKKNKELWLYK